MAVLQRMRDKFGIAISVIIALSLLYFIAPINDIMNLFGRPQNVGEINGKGVSYEDFQEQVDKYTTINEIVTGSSVKNEQAQKQIRDAAWQEFIDNYMFVKNAQAAGIKVGSAELVDLTTGEGASPMISQNPAFADENGAFNPENVRNFVRNIDNDESGRLRIYWNYLQNAINNQQYYARYASLFRYSSIANQLCIENEMAANNELANVDFVVASYPIQKDSTIKVSKSEINSYYNDHKDFFKQNASRDIEYVVFEVVPSASDIEATSREINECYDEFAATDNMKAFLLKHSDRSYSDYWYKAGELKTVNAELDRQVFEGAAQTPVIQDGNHFYAARVMESAMVSDSVYVKHMLFQGADAQNRADSLLNVLNTDRKADFSALAAIYSDDKGSAADGEFGNVGWMTQTYMLPGFESVITAVVGKPYIVKTQYGTHIVVVSKKTAPVAKKKVAILEKTALASNETYNSYYAQANTFAGITNGTYEGYKKALDSTKVYSHKLNNVLESTSNFGSVEQAREVTRWIYDAKKAGKASEIITVNNNYFFVVALKAIHKEGYTPVEEVASGIENTLYTRKMQEKTQADIAAKIAGMTDLEAIAELLGTSVQSNESLSLASSMGSRTEPALLGGVAAAQDGVISGPVAGRMGVYVFRVNSREKGSFYTEEDAKNMEASKVQYTTQMILPVMMDAAEVKDNRARFF